MLVNLFRPRTSQMQRISRKEMNALSPRHTAQNVVLAGWLRRSLVQVQRLRAGLSALHLCRSWLLLLLLLLLFVVLGAWSILPSALALIVTLLSQDVVHLFQNRRALISLAWMDYFVLASYQAFSKLS